MQLSAQSPAGAAGITLQACDDLALHHQDSVTVLHHESASSKASRDGGSAVCTASCPRLF